jgi:hypothetical protein
MEPMKTRQSVRHLGKDAAEARSKAEVGFHDRPQPRESNGPIAALGNNSIATWIFGLDCSRNAS